MAMSYQYWRNPLFYQRIYVMSEFSGQGLARFCWIFDRITQTVKFVFCTIKMVLGVTKWIITCSETLRHVQESCLTALSRFGGYSLAFAGTHL